MTQALKIAIFGLNTTDLNQLKTQISLCLPANTHLKWVNIAEDKIDVLLVSDVFFNSIGIQKVLKEKVKRGEIQLKNARRLYSFGLDENQEST